MQKRFCLTQTSQTYFGRNNKLTSIGLSELQFVLKAAPNYFPPSDYFGFVHVLRLYRCLVNDTFKNQHVLQEKEASESLAVTADLLFSKLAVSKPVMWLHRNRQLKYNLAFIRFHRERPCQWPRVVWIRWKCAINLNERRMILGVWSEAKTQVVPCSKWGWKGVLKVCFCG